MNRSDTYLVRWVRPDANAEGEHFDNEKTARKRLAEIRKTRPQAELYTRPTNHGSWTLADQQ